MESGGGGVVVGAEERVRAPMAGEERFLFGGCYIWRSRCTVANYGNADIHIPRFRFDERALCGVV